MQSRVRRPELGYAFALAAACFFAVNGTVSKVALGSGLEPPRLTALRCLGAAVGLALVLLATRPGRLRIGWRELPFVAVYGVVGVAMTQWLYFVAIGRLPVGIALLFEFTAVLLVALVARFGFGEPVRPRLWLALGLSLGGLALVAQVFTGGAGLDRVGVLAGLGAAAALATYFLMGERGVTRRDPVSLTFWSMAAGALFWSVLQPWWAFDPSVLGARVPLQGALAAVELPLWTLALWIVVLGTIVPFSLSVGALAHLPATTVGIAATAEPVLAGAVAWLWLGESLTPVQVLGGATVVLGIAIAQTARARAVPPQPQRLPATELVG